MHPVLPARHHESSGCNVRKEGLFMEVWLVLWRSCWISAWHCLVLGTQPSNDHSKIFSQDLKEMHLTLERLQGSPRCCSDSLLTGSRRGSREKNWRSAPAHLGLLLHLPGCHWEAPIRLCFPDTLDGSWTIPKSTLHGWIRSLAGVYGS